MLGLPWLIDLPWVQGRLAREANRIMAPAQVRFDHVHTSWLRPTLIDKLVLVDPQGDEIVVSPTARFSWNLWDIVMTRPGTATLTLLQPSVDIERAADGTIDLLESLQPILQDDPDRTILIRVERGKIRFRVEGLREPFLADWGDVAIDLNAAPGPITWKMSLSRTVENTPEGTVRIEGSVSRKKTKEGAPENLSLSLAGSAWPWGYSSDSLAARGAFSGTIDLLQKAERVGLTGDIQLLKLQAEGPALSGDRPQLDKLALQIEVVREGGVWSANGLRLDSALGTLSAMGTLPPTPAREAHLEGSLDLATLSRQIPHTLRLRDDLKFEKGSVQLRADAVGEREGRGLAIRAEAHLTDLAARHGEQLLTFNDPATLSARLHRDAANLSLEQLSVQTPFLKATGQGDLDQGIEVNATVDLEGAHRRLRDWMELGRLELAGQGEIAGRYQRIQDRFDARARMEFKGLKLGGLPVVDYLQRDRAEVKLTAQGAATPSGLPTALHALDVKGEADTERLTLTAARDPKAGVTSVSFEGHTQLVVNQRKQRAEATLASRWDGKAVLLDSLVFTMAPAAGPGGEDLPSEPFRWSGQGRYDVDRDELSIKSVEQDRGAKRGALPITAAEIRAGGLSTRSAAWFDVKLAGELAGLLASADRSREQGYIAGEMAALFQGKQGDEGWELGARVRFRDVSRIDAEGNSKSLAESAGVDARALVANELDRLALRELSVVTPYGRLEGAGRATGLRSSPQLDLKGTLSPDYTALSRLLAENVEPHASISGSPRAWSFAGKLPGSSGQDWLAGVRGEIGINIEQVDIFGMRLGKTALVFRAQDRAMKIDPIDTVLNSGRLHLEPELIKDKHDRSWIHLGSSSGLFDAVVNDEVSHRVLSFAAPVLDQATRVRGQVSVAISDAYLPLDPSLNTQAKVDGDVLFDSVEFMPGPFADQVLSVFRQESRPLLVLRDPVSIRLVGRKVYQEGLVVPVGKVAVLGLEGWIDFDQNLDLVASFAMVPPRQKIPVLSTLLENTQIQVPISGTLKKPRINGDAIGERFKDLGTNLLDKVLGVGANGLNDLLRNRPGRVPPPRDLFPPMEPDEEIPAPPAPGLGGQPDVSKEPAERPGQLTPEQRKQLRDERKQRRQDKRAERRMMRGLPPR
jgi:translocation and assembly module TamB